jgi:bacterioferritin
MQACNVGGGRLPCAAAPCGPLAVVQRTDPGPLRGVEAALNFTVAPMTALLEPVQLAPRQMTLDTEAMDTARRGEPPERSSAAWTQELVQLLNGALATELVCVLRYKRHHFTARGLPSPHIAEEFAVHAAEEMGHADRLAKRIVQLGGQPDFDPDTLTQRSHASYDAQPSLQAMIEANLAAERVAIETYGQLIRLVGDIDPTTRRLLEDILADEQQHADELEGWLGE